MTAKQLLRFIDSIKEVEGIDAIADDLFTKKGDLALKIELDNNVKDKKLYSDLAEKLEAIEMMKHQRLLFYKLSFCKKQ